MPDSSKSIEILVKMRDLASKHIKNLKKDMGGIQGVAKKTGHALQAMGNATRNTFNRLRSSIFSLQGMIVGLGLGLTARGFLDVASSFEDMQIKLDVLTKGKGRKTLEELNEWALKMPVNTQEAVASFTTMMAMGLDPTIEKMDALVNVASIFGDEVLSRVSRQLGQMASSARISSEDLNTIAETGLNVRKYLTEAFGSIEDLQKKVRTGAIDIKAAIDVIWKGMGEEYAGAAAKAQHTWRGLWNTFISFLVEIQRQVMAMGLFDYLKNAMGEINEKIENWMKSGFKEVLQNMPGYINKVESAAKSLWSKVKSVYELFSKLPDSIVGIAGIGIIGRILIGGPKGFLVMAAFLGYKIGKSINDMVYGAEDNLERLETKAKELREALKKGDVEGPDGLLYTLGSEYTASLERKLKLIEDSIKILKKTRDELAFSKKFALAPDEFLTPPPSGKKDDTTKKKVPKPVSKKAIYQAELKDLRTQTSRILGTLDYMYGQEEIKAGEYYAAKKLLIEQSGKDEIDILEKQRALATDPTKIYAADRAIVDAKEKQTDTLLALERERQTKLKEIREKGIQDAKEKEDEMLSQRSTMYDQMSKKGEGWLQTRVDQLQKEYAEFSKFAGNQDVANQWLEDRKRALAEEYLKETNAGFAALVDMSERTANAIEQAFSDYFFDLTSGKFDTFKEVAYNALKGVQRIATDVLGQIAGDWLRSNIREWLGTSKIVNALKKKIAGMMTEAAAHGKVAASMAIEAGAVYGLAAAYQVLALAKMAAGVVAGAGYAGAGTRGVTPSASTHWVTWHKEGGEVGTGPKKPVKAFSFLKQAIRRVGGGEIPGTSPTPVADNIPIMATAGEFMQPVKAVQYYGKQAMEKIRTMSIPKEVFSNIGLSRISFPTPRLAYAEGGEIGGHLGSSITRDTQSDTSRLSPMGGGGKGQALNIINVFDPSEFEGYLASPEGQDAIINVMSQRQDTVRKLFR